MGERHKVADIEDLPADGSRVIVDVKGIEIAVFRVDGEFHALPNYCPHQVGPLCEGGLSGRIETDETGWEWNYESEERYIHCPWHGWMFDVTTGQSPDSDDYRVPTYDVEIDDGVIYVLG